MPRPDRRMLDELVYHRMRQAVDPGVVLDVAIELGGQAGLGNLDLHERDLARRLVKRAWRRIGDDLLDLLPPTEEEPR